MFIRLTRLDNSPIWLNASFIVTVEPRRGGGTIVVPIGDGLDYEVREKAEAVLALLSDAPVPAVVPVPVSDCLTQTPDDVSPDPERSPEPEIPPRGGRPADEKQREADSKPCPPRGATSRADRGGRGATALPGAAIASTDHVSAEKPIVTPAAKATDETAPAEVASEETPSAEPSAEPEKPARKTRKTATKKTTAAKPRKRTTKKAAAAEEDALAEPQPEPSAAESAKPLEDGDRSANAEPSAAEPPAVEAAPAKAAAAKPRRSARDFAKPEVSDFPLSDDQIERLRKMMPKSVRKLSNTLVAQFKVEEPEAAIKGLEDRGVLRLEFNHVVWA